jgi:hypothetical protein
MSHAARPFHKTVLARILGNGFDVSNPAILVVGAGVVALICCVDTSALGDARCPKPSDGRILGDDCILLGREQDFDAQSPVRGRNGQAGVNQEVRLEAISHVLAVAHDALTINCANRPPIFVRLVTDSLFLLHLLQGGLNRITCLLNVQVGVCERNQALEIGDITLVVELVVVEGDLDRGDVSRCAIAVPSHRDGCICSNEA